MSPLKRYLEKIAQRGQRNTSEREGDSPAAGGPLPVLWLLGKTAAGKSSLIRCLTGLDEAQIGNGFEPCTQYSRIFNFPHEAPLLQFLDTRGLGEAGYQPEEDLHYCRDHSHVVLVLARLDDPVQQELAEHLELLSRDEPKRPIIVVHTARDVLTEPERIRAQAATQALFERAAKRSLPQQALAMPTGQLDSATGIDGLIELVAQALPEVAVLLLRERVRDEESNAFMAVRPIALRYASAAATSDFAPVVSVLAVPSTQALMLKKLAEANETVWTSARSKEFLAALGLATLTRFGSQFLARQLAKLIPAYGQTLGAMTAAAASFVTTYALARAANYYLFHVKQGDAVRAEDLRELYSKTLSEIAQKYKR